MKDQRAEDNGPSDQRQRKLGVCSCCESLVMVWKSPLSRQGVGSGNQKLLKSGKTLMDTEAFVET